LNTVSHNTLFQNKGILLTAGQVRRTVMASSMYEAITGDELRDPEKASSSDLMTA